MVDKSIPHFETPLNQCFSGYFLNQILSQNYWGEGEFDMTKGMKSKSSIKKSTLNVIQ